MYQIIHERPQDAAKIDPLLDLCFGPQRFAKTAYRIREGLTPFPELSLVALEEDGAFLATIRYWPVTIGGVAPALLLGPVAVQPVRQGEGIGVALIRESLKMAAADGHDLVVLVGDPDYYGRFGFQSAFAAGLEFPGPVEPHRFLVHELSPGALEGVGGMVAGNPLPARTGVAAGKLAPCPCGT